jgi:hemolysin III
MKSDKKIKSYSPLEEKLNIISHGIGFLLSITALIFLVVFAAIYGDVWHIVSFTIFGSSLIILYAASTLYHGAVKPLVRKRLKIVDHSAIYVLIAGTYTPFTLVTLNGATGWIIFGVSWGFAIIGITLKLFYTGKYDLFSTAMYILMGWLIIFAIKPLINNLPAGGLQWLFVGGFSYTVGALVYSIRKIKFNHAIFHILVLFGSFCHFIAVFKYLLPRN